MTKRAGALVLILGFSAGCWPWRGGPPYDPETTLIPSTLDASTPSLSDADAMTPDSTEYDAHVSPTCNPEEVKCSDQSCAWGRSCNGWADCADGSDEHDCACGLGVFTCGDGSCVPSDYSCDGYPDCADRRDETDCTGCNSGSLPCDGTCLPAEQQCDHWTDCADGTDEAYCFDVGSLSCGDISGRQCLTNTLVWCDAQGLHAVDCTASGKACVGFYTDSGLWDFSCGWSWGSGHPCDNDAWACDGDTLTACYEGRMMTYDCGTIGKECQLIYDETSYRGTCVAP